MYNQPKKKPIPPLYKKHLNNIRGVIRVVGSDPLGKIHRLFDFCDNPRDIDDPWYHRDFDRTYNEIMLGCKKFLEFLKNKYNF